VLQKCSNGCSPAPVVRSRPQPCVQRSIPDERSVAPSHSRSSPPSVVHTHVTLSALLTLVTTGQQISTPNLPARVLEISLWLFESVASDQTDRTERIHHDQVISASASIPYVSSASSKILNDCVRVRLLVRVRFSLPFPNPVLQPFNVFIYLRTSVLLAHSQFVR
jgi:hypothetical protein